LKRRERVGRPETGSFGWKGIDAAQFVQNLLTLLADHRRPLLLLVRRDRLLESPNDTVHD
jgi:hypothetical protein